MWTLRTMLILAVVASGCSAPPTGPRPNFVLNVSGTWQSALAFSLPTGTWSRTTVVLDQVGATVTGTMTSADGVRYALTGTLQDGSVHLAIEGLPGTSTCAGVSIVLSIFEYGGHSLTRIGGRAIGRCFGTVSATVVLDRTPD